MMNVNNYRGFFYFYICVLVSSFLFNWILKLGLFERVIFFCEVISGFESKKLWWLSDYFGGLYGYFKKVVLFIFVDKWVLVKIFKLFVYVWGVKIILVCCVVWVIWCRLVILLIKVVLDCNMLRVFCVMIWFKIVGLWVIFLFVVWRFVVLVKWCILFIFDWWRGFFI